MTRKEKKEELIGLFSTGAIYLGDLIDECFEFGQQHPQWISVEDDLPPLRQGVIAYNGVTNRIAWVLEDGSWIANTHKEWERNCFKQYPVTHWIPLPAIDGIKGNQRKISPNEEGDQNNEQP